MKHVTDKSSFSTTKQFKLMFVIIATAIFRPFYLHGVCIVVDKSNDDDDDAIVFVFVLVVFVVAADDRRIATEKSLTGFIDDVKLFQSINQSVVCVF